MILTDSTPIEEIGIPNPAKDQTIIPKIGQSTAAQSPSRWRTSNQNRIYSSKLFDALRRMRRADSPVKPHGRSIKAAADRALAVAARGRTRWSNAVLAGRSIRRKYRRIQPVRGGERRAKLLRSVRIPVVAKKVKILSRLIPGCRKLTLPLLLDEASDYIAALELQVRVMGTLAERLSGFAGGLAAHRPDSDPSGPIPS